mgnify:CR=1 FL=1
MKQPEDVVAARIDPNSGLLARPNQANGIIEYFRNKEVPAEDDPTPVYNASNDQQQLPTLAVFCQRITDIQSWATTSSLIIFKINRIGGLIDTSS